MKQRVISGAVLVVILAITLYFGGIVTCGLMALYPLWAIWSCSEYTE